MKHVFTLQPLPIVYVVSEYQNPPNQYRVLWFVCETLPSTFHQWLHPPNSLQDIPGQFCSQLFTLNTFIRIPQQILMLKCWAKSKMNKTNPINFWQSYIVQLNTVLLIHWAILSLSISNQEHSSIKFLRLLLQWTLPK